MIPAITSIEKLDKVVLSTGNIISLNNPQTTSELLDGLKLTLKCNEKVDKVGQVLRGTQELKQRITENERPEINIGAKLFLNKMSSAFVGEAVNTLLEILHVQHVDNLVLATFNPKPTNTTLTTDSSDSTAIKELNHTWELLEEFALNKQITKLGISDLDLETLTSLHSAARVKPTIAQINLASCCVVPPNLKEFCANHDIQLLTHSDPETLLPDEQFVIPGFSMDWALRYQVHVRCRGVLTAKGYIVGASKEKST